jgi:cytoskeletal protein CcmA (bactofilin family)
MSGDIIAQTVVTIHKTGSLEGNVTAKAITVEKGGIFSGQLVIGQPIPEQQKQIEALTAGLQKVSAQLEMSKAAPQTVVSNQ